MNDQDRRGIRRNDERGPVPTRRTEHPERPVQQRSTGRPVREVSQHPRRTATSLGGR